MEDSSAFEDVFVSIPRGGPIYIADMVGPLTSVSQFQSSIEDELKDLKKEVCMELTEEHHHDISIDELKTLTEDELVDIAFQASFKGSNLTRDPSTSFEDCSEGILDNGQVSKKMKRVTQDEEDYMVEVEKLARIKQKQEEDKSSARLHSFSGKCGPVSCVTLTEKKERMSSFNSTSYLTQKVKSSSTREQIPVDDNEILLCIEVHNYNNRRSWFKTQEIMVLGRQLLTELKDKIYCLTDEIIKLKNKHSHSHSGYFLIEDIFFNDLRETDAVDYSKPILDWLTESKKTAQEKWESIISGDLQQKQKDYLGTGSRNGGPKLPRFKTIPMQSTRFCDLNFRLGAGYLYCHQGDCKHLMVIRDMRLIHGEDVQNRVAYPLISFQSKLRFQKCSVCKIYKATKVTVDDKWTPENPCFFCGICYYMLHYSNNQLIYDDFKVFDYIHE
ncbi:hypothetical protein LXL04_032288 [Taraxacum kok-saghyz]